MRELVSKFGNGGNGCRDARILPVLLTIAISAGSCVDQPDTKAEFISSTPSCSQIAKHTPYNWNTAFEDLGINDSNDIHEITLRLRSIFKNKKLTVEYYPRDFEADISEHVEIDDFMVCNGIPNYLHIYKNERGHVQFSIGTLPFF